MEPWSRIGAPLTNEFPGFGQIPGFLFGNTDYTVGEIGGTANEIITVGAYTTKNSYMDFYGGLQDIPSYVEQGQIAPFSSKGPTLDGRVKPEITAPGNVIVSSVNSFDEEYMPGNSEVVTGVSDGLNDWYFASMQGTSMAAPMVTGIVALWLEANPSLTSDQIKELFKVSSWQDQFTGIIPVNGSNIWGHGKIDAHEGIKGRIRALPAQPSIGIVGESSFCEGQSATLTGPAGYERYLWSTLDTTQNISVNQSGDYYLQVIDENGWRSSASEILEIVVNPLPPKPSISFTDNTLFTDETSNIQWHDTNGPISGANSSSFQPEIDGNYFVSVENTFGCMSTSDILEVHLVGTNLVQEHGLEVYPNPTKDILIIESAIIGQYSVEIATLNGQLVYNTKIDGAIGQLDLSSLQKGVYFITIRTKAFVAKRKIIKL